MMAQSPFTWGKAGEKLTPKDVERRREAAALAAARGSDTSPVGHWSQGAARLIDAFGGYRGNVLAGKAEKEGQAGAKSIIDALMGGANASMGAPMQPVGAPLSAMQPPSGDIAGRLRMGMIERGLPEHVADGFLMNFQDESGMKPGINEANPTVPGSRGGFGLYQLTGPRRVAYEQFAAQRGVDPADPEAQLDFMIQELQGPEAGAAQSILSAPDAGSAAAAIARDFLRPAPQHLERRVAQYTGGQAAPGIASGPAGVSPVMQALLQASTDPWVAQEYGPVLQALMGQEGKRQDFEMQQSDPLRQLQIQQAQQEIDAPIEVGGVLLDRKTRQPIFDSRAPKASDIPTSVREYEYYAAQVKDAGQTPLPYADWEKTRATPAGGGVGAQEILEDGTIIQSTAQGPRVFGPDGAEVTGPAAAAAIEKARRMEVQNQREIYGARREGTLGADIALGGAAASAEQSGKIAADMGAEAYQNFQKTVSSLASIDEAIAAIDSGAGAGIAQKYLPNITLASASLENSMNRMGLDVISSVTFGALSEGEMALAMNTAVPRDLAPAELRQWLSRKRDAQQKASEALLEAARYLSRPGNTIQTWTEQMAAPAPTAPPPPAATRGAVQPAGPDTAPVTPVGPMPRRLRYNPATGALE